MRRGSVTLYNLAYLVTAKILEEDEQPRKVVLECIEQLRKLVVLLAEFDHSQHHLEGAVREPQLDAGGEVVVNGRPAPVDSQPAHLQNILDLLLAVLPKDTNQHLLRVVERLLLVEAVPEELDGELDISHCYLEMVSPLEVVVLHILKQLPVGLVLLPQAQHHPEENAEDIDVLGEEREVAGYKRKKELDPIDLYPVLQLVVGRQVACRLVANCVLHVLKVRKQPVRRLLFECLQEKLLHLRHLFP